MADHFPVHWQRPGDEHLVWEFRASHVSRPLTPISQSLAVRFVAGRNRGGVRGTVRLQFWNGYWYWATVAPAQKRPPGEGVARWEGEFLPRLQADHARWRAVDLAAPADGELAAVLEQLADMLEEHYAIHFALGFTEAVRPLAQMCGEAEAARLLQGLPNKTTEADAALWRLARQSPPALDEFLAAYGWRLAGTPQEFGTPTWVEDPSPVLALLRHHQRHPTPDPEALRRRAAAEAEALAEAVRRRLPPAQLPEFEARLDLARRAFPLTEDHNYYIDQISCAIVRHALAEAGRRLAARGALAQAADVQWLYLAEVCATLRGAGPSTLHLAAERQARHAAWEKLTPPPRLGGAPPDAEPDRVRGLAASGGVASGPARVVRTFAEAQALQPGEVLVCAFTDATWTPLFAIAAALVTDTGGILSHGALVAREYGLPAVVGTRVGTRRIRTGQQVTVDGDNGIVT